MKPTAETEGEFEGWYSWRETDPFENASGPFYIKLIDGEAVCAMRLERRHMNGHGGVHGGCVASFADHAAFAVAGKHVEHGAVTVSLKVDYLNTAAEGERLESRGDLLKAGGSLIFVRGVVTSGDRSVASYEAILKKLKPRA